jgi:hypothetical protein
MQPVMYALVQHPRHVLDEAGDTLPGHYVVRFASVPGAGFDRFLTDRGYAELLRLLDEGRQSFSADEVEALTTPPTLEDLLATMQAESGVGG